MRRFALLLPIVWVCFWSGLAASSSTGYTSPHTKLSYRHERIPGVDGVETRHFVIPAPSGNLMLTITNGDGEYRLTSSVESTGSKSILSYSPPSGSGVAEVALSWPGDRMTARFADHAEPGRLERIAGTTPNCEQLREGELPRLRREVFDLVRTDYAAWSDPPRHLEALVAALYFSRVVPLVAAGCEDSQDPAAGTCYAGYLQHGDCLQCCENEAGIEAFMCHAAARVICTNLACMGLGGLVCGGIANLSAHICAAHNCRGKLGDPGCNQAAPCEGTCMYFCGIGWSAGCGQCNGQAPFHSECCQ